MYTNPLRVLDSKNPVIQELLNQAPKLFDYLDEESKLHFHGLCQLLDSAGIKYNINQRLVRGLDYYNRTVFEWVTNSLGAQGTVCGGGRYDGLVSQLGGQPTPAVGFAMGVERLVLLVQAVNPSLNRDSSIDIYMISSGDEKTIAAAQKMAEVLRDGLTDKRIVTNYGSSNFKKQFAKADKLGAKIAVIIGENEITNQSVTIKNLQTGEQVEVAEKEIVQTCLAIL